MSLSDGYHAVARGKLAMVVTYLEMTTPAKLRGKPCPKGLEFARFPPDPDAYRALIRHVGQDWLWFARLVLDDLVLCSIIENESVEIYTLLQDGAPSAILELDFRGQNDCEVQFFGVGPSLIGSGAGSYLMDRAIEIAWARDISRLHLHTCTLDSPQALSFYQRSGFTPYRRDIEIADDPRSLGVLPDAVAPHIPIL